MYYYCFLLGCNKTKSADRDFIIIRNKTENNLSRKIKKEEESWIEIKLTYRPLTDVLASRKGRHKSLLIV